MGRLFIEYCEDDDANRYTCLNCGVDVANSSAVIWSGHMGLQKPAYLLRSTTGNVVPISRPRQERLHSGLYTLQTLGCRCCSAELGWLYVGCHGHVEQRYKQGCALLEQAMLRACPSRSSLARARQELRKMQRRTGPAPPLSIGGGSSFAGGPSDVQLGDSTAPPVLGLPVQPGVRVLPPGGGRRARRLRLTEAHNIGRTRVPERVGTEAMQVDDEEEQEEEEQMDEEVQVVDDHEEEEVEEEDAIGRIIDALADDDIHPAPWFGATSRHADSQEEEDSDVPLEARSYQISWGGPETEMFSGSRDMRNLWSLEAMRQATAEPGPRMPFPLTHTWGPRRMPPPPLWASQPPARDAAAQGGRERERAANTFSMWRPPGYYSSTPGPLAPAATLPLQQALLAQLETFRQALTDNSPAGMTARLPLPTELGHALDTMVQRTTAQEEQLDRNGAPFLPLNRSRRASPPPQPPQPLQPQGPASGSPNTRNAEPRAGPAEAAEAGAEVGAPARSGWGEHASTDPVLEQRTIMRAFREHASHGQLLFDAMMQSMSDPLDPPEDDPDMPWVQRTAGSHNLESWRPPSRWWAGAGQAHPQGLDHHLAERQLVPPQGASMQPMTPLLPRSLRRGSTRWAWPSSSAASDRRRELGDGGREGVRGVEAPGAGAEPIPCLPPSLAAFALSLPHSPPLERERSPL